MREEEEEVSNSARLQQRMVGRYGLKWVHFAAHYQLQWRRLWRSSRVNGEREREMGK